MKHWILWFIAGVISIVGGVIALANPFAASITAELLTGWSFIFVGVIALISVFGDRDWKARILALLLGVLLLSLGINLVGKPLSGLIALTYAVAVFMAVAGVVRMILAFRAEFRPFRMFLILSGAVSLLLSVMIFSNFPQSAAVVLGIYLAIELISNGVSLIAISLARKSADADAI